MMYLPEEVLFAFFKKYGVSMGLFSNIFKTKKQNGNMTELINGFTPTFLSLCDVDNSDVFATAVQTNARHISKLRFEHYYIDNKGNRTIKKNSFLGYLLNLRPNKFMNAATFWEKAAYAYYTYNNLFIYIERDSFGYAKSLWVLDPHYIRFLKDVNGGYWLDISLNDSQFTVSFEDIIHIARNVNANEFLGTDNAAIYKVLQLIDTNYQGIEHAIKLSAFIKFIVTTTTNLSPGVLEKRAKEFTDQWLDAKKDGGVIFTGAGNTVTPVSNQPKYTNADEQKILDLKVNNYLGVNEKIINSLYSEDEWQSYYESTLEPFVIKIEKELTYKFFTDRQIGFGNEIAVIADKLQHATFGTRIKMITETREIGAMTVNEIRELLYMAAVPDGDVRQVSLNFVKSDKQDEYQLSKAKTKEVNDDNKG